MGEGGGGGGGDIEKRRKTERKMLFVFFITKRLKVKISAKRFFFIFSECCPMLLKLVHVFVLLFIFADDTSLLSHRKRVQYYQARPCHVEAEAEKEDFRINISGKERRE